MALLHKVVFLYFLFTISSAALLHEVQTSNNRTCHHEGTYHEVNSTWQGPDCTQLECMNGHSPNTVILTIVSCGTVAVPPGCTSSIDHSKPYPECCTPIIDC